MLVVPAAVVEAVLVPHLAELVVEAQLLDLAHLAHLVHLQFPPHLALKARLLYLAHLVLKARLPVLAHLVAVEARPLVLAHLVVVEADKVVEAELLQLLLSRQSSSAAMARSTPQPRATYEPVPRSR